MVEESNVAMRAWLGVNEGVAKGRRGSDRGKRVTAVTSGTKLKGAKGSGQGTLAGWVVRAPKDGDGVQGKHAERGHWDAELTPGGSGGEAERDRLEDQASETSLDGAGDVGPVYP